MLDARVRSLAFALCAVACGTVAPPPPSDSGWTLRYAHRTGQSANGVSNTLPELTFAILNGRARVSVAETERVVRFTHRSASAQVCRGVNGLCTTVPSEAALVELTGSEDLHPIASGQDSEPTIVRDTAAELVANLRTEGARFESHLRSPHGTTHFTVDVRWISSPDDPNTEAVRRVMTTALELLGARRLVDAIHQTVGLPLSFDVSISDERADGETVNGIDVYRASSIDNPPPAL